MLKDTARCLRRVRSIRNPILCNTTRPARSPIIDATFVSGWGRIVSTSSQMGMISAPGKAPYSATKAGLIGLTKVKSFI